MPAMEQNAPAQGNLNLRRGDSNLSQAAAVRSNTAPVKQERHHHLPRRLHANTLGGKRNHHYRQDAKNTIQSATELKPPISFEHFLRRDKKQSAEHGRRDSQQGQPGSGLHNISESVATQPGGGRRLARERVLPQDVEKERRRNELRNEELKDSLKIVEDLGMQSTAQLDETYYTILEKASALRSIVASLQDLVDQSREMHANFKSEAATLEKETVQSIEGFGDFSQQQETVGELVDRLAAGKAETERLNKRLQVASDRIEAYDQRQMKQQATTKQRWYMAWTGLVGLIVLFLALLLTKHRRAVGDALDGVAQVVGSPLPAFLQPRETLPEDPYLQQLFDHL